jgi:hypothetical protein
MFIFSGWTQDNNFLTQFKNVTAKALKPPHIGKPSAPAFLTLQFISVFVGSTLPCVFCYSLNVYSQGIFLSFLLCHPLLGFEFSHQEPILSCSCTDTKGYKVETLEQPQSLRIYKQCYKNTELASGIVQPVLQLTVGVNIYMRANINCTLQYTLQKLH